MFVYICAVRGDGQLVCFGRIFHDQCDVPELWDLVLAVAAGPDHTCVSRSDDEPSRPHEP